MTDELAIGIGFKVYHYDYSSPDAPPDYSMTDTTTLLDGGILWRGAGSRVLAGGTVQNLGPALEIGRPGESYSPAWNLKLAFGARLVDLEAARGLVACDLNIPLAGEDNNPRLMAGSELLAGRYAAMRIRCRYDGWALRDESHLEDPQKHATTIGFGLRIREFTFDYANAPGTCCRYGTPTTSLSVLASDGYRKRDRLLIRCTDNGGGRRHSGPRVMLIPTLRSTTATSSTMDHAMG